MLTKHCTGQAGECGVILPIVERSQEEAAMIFKERAYLRVLLDEYRKSYGDRIPTEGHFVFANLNLERKPDGLMAFFRKDTKLHFAYIKEAQRRGLIETDPQKFRYTFTPAGYSRARECRHPIKYFFKKHWRWVIATSIATVVAAATVAAAIIAA